MAITSVPPFRLPGFTPSSNSLNPAFTAILLDAAGEKAVLVCRAPKTGTISKVAFKVTTVTSSGSADVRLETVDTSTGNPTGTLLGTNTNGSQSITTTNEWDTTTLTAGASVTQGDLLAVVISNVSGNYNIASLATLATTTDMTFPYSDNNTGAFSKSTSQPVVALEYNDGSYDFIPGIIPVTTITNTAFNSGSTPDERGLYFQYPVSIRVCGVSAFIDADNACDIVLYDSDGSTVLRSVSIASGVRNSANGGTHNIPFSSAVTLSANTNYRLVVKPTSGSNVTLCELEINSAALMGAMPGGPNFHFTSRTDAGAWTEVTTRYPTLGMIVDGIDSGGGGGPLIDGRLILQ